LPPFDDPPAFHIAASAFFLGGHAVGPTAIMEDEPLPLRAAGLVVLVDSSKFVEARSLVMFPLSEVDVLVSDDGISDRDRRMPDEAGVEVLIAPLGRDDGEGPSADGAADPRSPTG
jgi:DeoR family ulaG and ulaABCDEF operon transcriptional repressor